MYTLYTGYECWSILTCGVAENGPLQEATDVEVAAPHTLLSRLLLFFFLPSWMMLSVGGGGKGLGAASLK